MRVISAERILQAIPAGVSRVGLVGAAVSDHPQLVELLNQLHQRGCSVGLSSLRPDRLKEPLVEALALVKHHTLTTALDGASERVRQSIDRQCGEQHYREAARLARKYKMERLKLYLMLGLPGEKLEDVDECAQFVSELTSVIPIVLGVSPFCAKRNTPFDKMPFAGIANVQKRLRRLRLGLAGRAEVRATSSRWAWVEHVLAQGGPDEGKAVLHALRDGGTFAAYRRAFEALGHHPEGVVHCA
jgi:radical SAM superfamily enzyme YgiQ (UPF0313 family)